jgi:hypothetical protein
MSQWQAPCMMAAAGSGLHAMLPGSLPDQEPCPANTEGHTRPCTLVSRVKTVKETS